MRSIKFRAWHTNGDMFFVGDDFGTKHPLDCAMYAKQGQPVTLMQFTGLFDKNGKEVYEGDICSIYGLAYRIEYIQEYMTFCPFTKEQWQWYKDGSNHFKYCYEESHQGEGSPIYFLSLIDSYEIEIIGDIHTTPELLK